MNNPPKRELSGIVLIFSTYFYFLIFAQFAFVEIALKSGATEQTIKILMACMAGGGLVGSFLVLLTGPVLPQSLMGCSACAIAACFAPSPAQFVIGFGVGLSVGALTVSLATVLRSFFDARSWGVCAALGTGLAYFLCNVPSVFNGSPRFQSALAGVICVLSIPFVSRAGKTACQLGARSNPLPVFLLFFATLVWLDSAAFYIIQHSPLKEGTWSAASNLWRNAGVHLLAGLGGGILAQRKGFKLALFGAFALLAPAALIANDAETRALAGWLYPAGVSVYSTCLVAFPSFGASETTHIARRAAFLYSIGGWIGSGLGIGMAQNLSRVPWQFAVGATSLLVIGFFWHLRKEMAFAALVLVPASIFASFRAKPEQIDGRAVYRAEGCINCHSQYVKPNSSDVLLWGPAQPLEPLLAGDPPLFGNRRQGPDLLNIGNRRSRAWLKEHFVNPRLFAPGSSMPSYGYLFNDGRGEALLDYLVDLGTNKFPERMKTIQTWKLPADLETKASGEQLFLRYCAVCHEGDLREKLKRTPPDFRDDPWVYAPLGLPEPFRRQRIAQIVKFGIPGTDMPGHEYLSNEHVFALILYLERLSVL